MASGFMDPPSARTRYRGLGEIIFQRRPRPDAEVNTPPYTLRNYHIRSHCVVAHAHCSLYEELCLSEEKKTATSET